MLELEEGWNWRRDGTGGGLEWKFADCHQNAKRDGPHGVRLMTGSDTVSMVPNCSSVGINRRGPQAVWNEWLVIVTYRTHARARTHKSWWNITEFQQGDGEECHVVRISKVSLNTPCTLNYAKGTSHAHWFS